MHLAEEVWMLTFSLLTRASRLWGASLTVVLLSFSGASIIQVRVAAQDFSLLNCATSSSGNPCVLTSQYNPQRTAYNNNETALTSATVGNSGTAVLQQLNLFQVDPTCSGRSDVFRLLQRYPACHASVHWMYICAGDI